jgi:DNA primase
MRYSPNLLEEILRRTDIVQLVGRRVKLTRKGQAFWGCCPFHGEKTASFKVENGRRTYKCFGCGKGGDAFRWLMETEGLSFPEAVGKLAGEAGVELPKWSAEDEAREEKKKSLTDIIALAADFFAAQLFEPGGRAARDYLKGRGLDQVAAGKFRLGYAPADGKSLIAHLTAKNVTLDDMIATGLARAADEHHGVRDFFFNRLMFPISDGRGTVVAFGGRGLTADAKPKYINTGETEFFSKGRLLYNFHQARPAGIKAGTIIVCEGYMDVIALVQAGFEAAVAPLGTALTEDQLQLLWRVAPEPVLSFDGDTAGRKAALRAAHLALPHLKAGYSLRFGFLPTGEDPDSLIRTRGAAAMQAVFDATEPLSDMLWKSETEDKDLSTPERRAGLERALAELIGRIADGKVADYYRRDFDSRVFEAFKRRPYTPRTAQTRERRFNKEAAPALPPSAALKHSRLVQAGAARTPRGAADGVWRPHNPGARKVKEEEVCRYLLEDPELAATHAEQLAKLPFSDPLLDSLRQELLNVAVSGSRLEKTGLETHLIRRGMAGIVERLKARYGRNTAAEGDAGEDADARFQRAAQELRDLADRDRESGRDREHAG